ncbi:OmpA family protein [Chitinophaga oryzae]|uniref:OmpA family protein n=1 Tax=Chitinophaga oryzae TaxID=2725414 RepID=A0AAE6ZHX0_9BACT|nr:OmpA family protein [Chitinophaga oryzae]QJB32467.1 OmpA family protein [Chitinophaga oryzae]QJB38939.1 OmpA family protein [Chitinophaga oryzae]
MKKVFLLLGICTVAGTTTQAQLFDRIKNKVQQKVNEKIDKTIDDATAPKKKGEQGSTNSGDTPAPEDTGNNAPVAANSGPANTDIKSYSRFDFIPGEKIIVQENFAQDPVGEFPGQWNTRSGAEIVTVSNRPGKWLAIKQDGIFYPEYLTSNLPDNFTLQVDIMASNGIAGIGMLTVSVLKATGTEEKFDLGGKEHIMAPSFKVGLAPKSSGQGYLSYSSNLIGDNTINGLPVFNVPKKNYVRLSLWRQKQRVRVYLDSTKIVDLPRALDAGAVLNTLAFAAYAPDYDQQDGTFYIGNITLAVGAPDTRNKLITEGKFISHGILFDTNSDQIKPESYGALKDIANVLTESAAIRVKIVGHTDADGNEKLNLDLSKRRAEAVKAALVKDFGIDVARLETDGKGKTQPIDNNNTEVGKANNRRVEFIKL